MIIKPQYPQHELTLPISNKHIVFRPYLVKEEKVLLMALESNNRETYLRAIKQIMEGCILGEIKVDDLPLLDIEYFFLRLRAVSVGEVVTKKYKCENIVDNKSCNNIFDIKVNLNDIKVENVKTAKEMTLKLGGNLAVKMKYPKFNSNFSAEESIAAECLEVIFEGENAYYTKDFAAEDIVEFFESLTKPQFSIIEKFFESLPNLKTEVKHKCKKCGYDHEFTFEGYESFFV